MFYYDCTAYITCIPISTLHNPSALIDDAATQLTTSLITIKGFLLIQLAHNSSIVKWDYLAMIGWMQTRCFT